METKNRLWIDKLKLTFIVIKKETDMIELYSMLISSINQGILTRINVNTSSNYHGCWNMVHELYNFLRYNKIQELRKNKEMEDKVKKLENIVNKYESISEITNFSELQEAVLIVEEIVSLSGYHDDKTFRQEGTLEDEEFV